MILLIVTIGLLNICLGFGLSMYYGYGPPGLDGIFEALGAMPPAVPVPLAGSFVTAYDPMVAVPANMSPAAPSAEEQVLGAVRDLAGTAQSAMLSGPVESRE